MSNVIEQLEQRQMMAGDPMFLQPIFYFYPTPVYVNGTAGADNIYVGNDGAGNVVVTNNGAVSSYAAWLVSKVVVTAGDGNDFVYTYSDVTTPVEINGGNGNDNLYGGGAADSISGAGGADYIFGAGGNDNLDGGVAGTANYFDNNGNDAVYGGEGDDTINASDYGNCVLGGGNGNDVLYGWQGATTLSGDNGNDYLYGYTGADTAYGGYGADYISTGAGNDVIYGGADNDVEYAGPGNDVVHGDAGDDYLFGQDGDDKLYGDAGCDVLCGGNGNDVLVTIGGGQNDCLYGEGGYDSFWCDSEGTENVWDADAGEVANGHVHRVGSYMNYTYKNGSIFPWDWTNIAVSRDATGQNLADPIGGSNYQNFSNRPLFSTSGPSKDDIDQNALADCYFLAGLGAVAKANPDRIRQHIVELGDGTYAVQFNNTFIRVDGDLPTSGGNLVYAGLGTGNSNWVAIMEKAFAYYRHGDSDYHSIEWGWMDEAYSAMGVGSNGLNVDGWYKFWNNSNNLWDYVNTELASGKAVTVATNSSVSSPFVYSHVYMVDRTYVDGYGTRHVVLRNPWSGSGAGDPAAYVDVTAQQLFDNISRVQSASV